ncbi:MAG: (d)CMP kinase [Candidatus Omnitrophica bacterium]|nr:(d)CMP kinase [Candidatus Omnitrophota bacterium]
MIVAIDGPAGSGKSTVARMTAHKLGFLYIDTGAMYRAVTFKALEKKIDLSDEGRLVELARDSDIRLVGGHDGALTVYLDGRDVSREIREPVIAKYVSDIAKVKGVREAMVLLQRRMGRDNNAVLEGRDITTVVFPNAEKKFYIDADFAERARRRHKELLEAGKNITLKEVEDDLRNRDYIDSSRKVAPLKKAADAQVIDTTHMTIDQVVDTLLTEIKDTAH